MGGSSSLWLLLFLKPYYTKIYQILPKTVRKIFFSLIVFIALFIITGTAGALRSDIPKGVIDILSFARENPLRVATIKKLEPYLNASLVCEELAHDLSPFWEEIDKNILIHLKEKARFFLHIGKTVVVDLAAIKEDLDYFKDLRPIYCLVYCPLTKLAKHYVILF